MWLVVKVTASLVFWTALFGALLFAPGGTVHWWRGWVFLGVFSVLNVVAVVRLFTAHRALIEERVRLPLQQGQPLADKIVVSALLVTFCGLLVAISLDVFRFHLLGAPGPFVAALGLPVFVAGWWIAYLALRENAFAATAVKHAARQTVIDTGVYGVVRHPMYAGGILVLIGMALWLDSSAGVLLALVPTGVIVLRILLEERFLRRELSGYEAYTRRVRYRLVPALW